MDRRYEVVVVGAGPSGSAAARVCAEAGLSTLMLEEQAHIGVPVQCAGLLSNSAFSECHVSSRSVLNTVSGATVAADSGKISFDAGKIQAYVVDRAVLDQEMAKDAADSGAEILIKTRATGLDQAHHCITSNGVRGKEQIKYRILIAADGPRANIARMAGLPRAPLYLSGLQCDIPWETDQTKVTIYPNASPEFFGWIIPIGQGRARVGMCGITHVREKFEKFLSGFGHRSIHFVSGTIPLGTLRKSYCDGIMVVGDAGAFAKPTSGGGVYTGVRSARHAADVAIVACENERYDQFQLSEYEHRWKRDFGKELQIGLAAFKLRQYIKPGDMDKILKLMNDPDIQDLIVRKGDMDRPVKLLKNLLVHPRMYFAAGIFFRSIIHSSLKK